jgi:hypothetical protein
MELKMARLLFSLLALSSFCLGFWAMKSAKPTQEDEVAAVAALESHKTRELSPANLVAAIYEQQGMKYEESRNVARDAFFEARLQLEKLPPVESMPLSAIEREIAHIEKHAPLGEIVDRVNNKDTGDSERHYWFAVMVRHGQLKAAYFASEAESISTELKEIDKEYRRLIEEFDR